MVATTFTANSFTQLNTDIEAIDANGAQAAANTAYTIEVTAGISLGVLEAINLMSGSHPGGFQIAGVGDFNGAGNAGVLWHASS